MPRLLRAREVGQVLLGRRARLHAHGRALQLLGVLDLALDRDHEALAVVVGDAGELHTQRGVARQRPGGVARQDVDLTRLQRSKSLLRIQWHELDLVAVAEHRCRDRAADVDVEPGPVALAVGLRKARQPRVHAADHLSAGLDGVQRLARMRGSRRQRRCRHQPAGHDPACTLDHQLLLLVDKPAARVCAPSIVSCAAKRPNA